MANPGGKAPHSYYARPGEIDLSILETTQERPKPKPNPYVKEALLTPPSKTSESEPRTSKPNAKPEPGTKSTYSGAFEEETLTARPYADLWGSRERKSAAAVAMVVEEKQVPVRPVVKAEATRESLISGIDAPQKRPVPSLDEAAKPWSNSRIKSASTPAILPEAKPLATGTEARAVAARPEMKRVPAPEVKPLTAREEARPQVPVAVFSAVPAPPMPIGMVEPKSSQLRVGAGMNLNLKRAPLALSNQAAAGRKVSARFEMLPDHKPQWGRMGASAVGQLAVLGFLLMTPMLFPQEMRTALKFDVVELMMPMTEIPVPKQVPPPPPPKIKHNVKPPELKPEPPPMPEPPKLNPKQPHVFLLKKPELPQNHVLDTKPLELKPKLEKSTIVLESAGPKEPPKPAPAVATVKALAENVQTGGHGDPNGIEGPANANKAGNISQKGLANLPGGAGFGNGLGGAKGIRGTVAGGGGKGGAGSHGAVTSTVEILSKPTPTYSAEARDLRTQGDVVLEVVFRADGFVDVVRVVSGLGHGLDEAAIAAAKRIRFTPAKSDRQAVDFSARLRIEFRLID
jgi:TonB family protein